MEIATNDSSVKRFKNTAYLVYMVGGLVILLAIASFVTDQRLTSLFDWLQQVFGWGYAIIYGGLLATGLFAWSRIQDLRRAPYWIEVGSQAANGIATLSLTFTLLGISLGIGSLSEQTLNPETVHTIIQDLTRHFSTAFMTTVVGLPTASVLRAAIAIRYARIKDDVIA